ncbi:MAG: class I SAM-dependent methyltransferase [Deltaproteobacteria bacterium]|nr:class I SAM-dependent methyltransferase [Deltaproteobacteria bacterium]
MGLIGRVLRSFVFRGTDLFLLSFRPRLLPAYLAIWRAEWSDSPYVRARSAATQRRVAEAETDPDDLTYGETPLVTALWVLRKLGVGRGRAFVDLGAGRGRVVLAARWLGADAAGVELAEEHVRAVKPSLERAGARLSVGDATKVGWTQPTDVYVNWTAFAPATRARVLDRLVELPLGSMVACPTFPIERAELALVFTVRAPLTWGFERIRAYRRVAG